MQPGLFLMTAWCCGMVRVRRSFARLVVGFSSDLLERDACVAGQRLPVDVCLVMPVLMVVAICFYHLLDVCPGT